MGKCSGFRIVPRRPGPTDGSFLPRELALCEAGLPRGGGARSRGAGFRFTTRRDPRDSELFVCRSVCPRTASSAMMIGTRKWNQSVRPPNHRSPWGHAGSAGGSSQSADCDGQLARGLAQIVGRCGIADRARQNHAAHAQCRDTKRLLVRLSMRTELRRERAHHHLEDFGKRGLYCSPAAPTSVGRPISGQEPSTSSR
jgi:hypothetical protein